MCCATRAATSWPMMGGTPDRSNTILATSRLLRRFATRRSHRIGLRISGEIEINAPADANGRPFAAPGGGEGSHLGRFETIPSYAQWVPFPTLLHPVTDTLWPAALPLCRTIQPRTRPPSAAG